MKIDKETRTCRVTTYAKGFLHNNNTRITLTIQIIERVRKEGSLFPPNIFLGTQEASGVQGIS